MATFAIVGASQRHIPWTEWVMASLASYRYPGRVELVNPRYEEMLGQRCYPSIEELPEPPEAAIIAVGAAQVVAQVERLLAAGCRQMAIVTNGFGETGTEEGRAREVELRRACAGFEDARVLGPNCIGFASFHDELCAIAQPTPKGLRPGAVSIVSQSGGLTGATLGALGREGVGADVAYSIGNGTVFGIADAVRAASARPTTRVVCAVVESIGDADALRTAAEGAQRAGTEIVALLLGRSEGSKGVARSHTGMVVGEQKMVAAWLGRLGVTVVGSVDELAAVSHLLGRVGRPAPSKGAFIATVSGGGAGLSADLASRHGLRLAGLTEQTRDRLRGLLPPGAWVGNPLDIATGDVPGSYAAIVADPGVGCLIEPWNLPWPDTSPDFHWQRAAIERVALVGETAGIPVIVGSLFEQPLSDWARQIGDGHPGLCVSSSLERTMAAIALLQGADVDGGGFGRGPTSPTAGPAAPAASARFVAEAEARLVLAGAGLPVVEGDRVGGAEQAAELAGRLRPPWAVKVAAPSVAHKERIGGVRLGLSTPDEVRAACAGIKQSALEAGVDELEISYLVTEMVFGPELLLGAVRDPLVGPSVSVAVGGWAAESGAVFGTIPLPAGAAELRGHLERWGLVQLLGAKRAEGLLEVLARLGDEFAGGSLSGYSTVEVNPLVLGADGPVVVDALLVG